MSKIDRISHVRNLGVFHSFDWPEDLLIFGRFNLIYGWNGSGKTTISKLMRALEMKTEPVCDEVVLSISGGDVCGYDFRETTLPIRVFNRDFVTDSIFPVGGGDVPPIFVVGTENIVNQKKIEVLKTKLAEFQKDLKSERLRKQKLETDINKFCSDRAKAIKEMLRSPGENPYNNYNKSDFRKCIEKMAKDRDIKSQLLELDRDKLLAQHRSSPKSKLLSIAYQFTAVLINY